MFKLIQFQKFKMVTKFGHNITSERNYSALEGLRSAGYPSNNIVTKTPIHTHTHKQILQTGQSLARPGQSVGESQSTKGGTLNG